VRRFAQDDESVGEPEKKQQVRPLRCAPVGMTNPFKGPSNPRTSAVSRDQYVERFSQKITKAHRVLWYPTQAKGRLEWGTQPSLVSKIPKKVAASQDD
jgi:hypothetical protein